MGQRRERKEVVRLPFRSTCSRIEALDPWNASPTVLLYREISRAGGRQELLEAAGVMPRKVAVNAVLSGLISLASGKQVYFASGDFWLTFFG